MRKIGCLAALCFFSQTVDAATVLAENFDSFSALLTSGWTVVNNSTAPASTSWFQGDPTAFSSQSGAANSYAAANFLNAGFGGNISDWLLTPVLSLANGSTISFYTRSAGAAPDRLELRFSANGSSANVGGTTTSVGDFSTLFLTVNPGLTAGGYPTGWTQYNVTVSGLAAGFTLGRLAFRYNVTDTSANGDYIGIDTLLVSTAVPEPATLSLALAAGLGVWLAARRRSRQERTNFMEGDDHAN